ncbi:hypothetical protein [Pseudoclavibacter sp. VKM Ac-2888]|uniref:hypothetical protein n=1 Tax=Pseudoclavibacter sp. VKM Ac-2888 TaxID=2783830 RepID=UPI00188B26ED|nr:hypothetical protein [Pseudoclavibacter sp. VKM Ac-2888]MBF4549432.1 hypothetical protein [Pseudoclavibacter sp. VKM Ac-2888]
MADERRTDFPLPDAWTRDALVRAGFEGFVPLIGLNGRDLPPGRGIYVVLRADPVRPPLFSDESLLRAYAIGDLERRWIDGAEVLYIGKAERGLRDRLGGFKPNRANHSGGRSIWQLAEADTLQVCWVETPRDYSQDVEGDHVDAFVAVYGRRPFANVAPPARGTVQSRSSTPKPVRGRGRRGQGRELVFVDLDAMHHS